MKTHYRPWETYIKDLYQNIRVIDEHTSLLREIDREISNKFPDGLEGTFIKTIENFSKIHRLVQPCLCYIYCGKKFHLLNKSVNNIPDVLDAVPSISQWDFSSINGYPHKLLHKASDEYIYNKFRNAKSILAFPLFSSFPSNVLFCIFLIPSEDEEEGSEVRVSNLIELFNDIITQLTIALRYQFDQDQKKGLADIFTIFLKEDMAPTKCFESLASIVPSILPKFGPLKLNVDPEVQILIYDKKRDEFVIRATTGKEPDTTRVEIKNSICGYLIEKTEDDLLFFCDDPTKDEYKERYKDYLGSPKGKTIRTELAIRLKLNGDIIGILNLESDIEDIFNLHHIIFLRDLADKLAPIVNALERRLNQNKESQNAYSSTMSRYLDNLASIFQHGINTPIVTFRSEIFYLGNVISNESIELLKSLNDSKLHDNDKIRKFRDNLLNAKASIDRLSRVQLQFTGFITEFILGISGYGKKGDTDINLTISQIISLAKRSLLMNSKLGQFEIKIKYEPPNANENIIAFASPLIRQHLYCILHNSILSIQERMEKVPDSGLIEIYVERDTTTYSDKQNREVNKYFVITIRDNGTGVDSKQLEELRKFKIGTHFRDREGSGFGLVSAQRYLSSIFGRINIDSEKDKFFEARIFLEEWNEKRHAPYCID